LTETPDDTGLAQLTREIERNWLRTQNGMKIFSGKGFARSDITPKDIIWRARKAELSRYRSTVPKRFRTPVLMYVGLVSQSYVFDLHQGNSFVERFLNLGFDVYVLDWGIPDAADADNDIATYAHEMLPRAIRATVRESGTDDLNLIAYCMGGCLTLSMLATRDDIPVRSLITMATPVDFSQMGEFFVPLREGSFELDRAIDDSGNVPANVIRSMVNIRRPTDRMVEYATLWQNLWNEEFLEGFESMREWVADHVPFPGAAFREVMQQWMRKNGFFTGDLSVGGKRADLSRITCATLCMIAEYDEMVPLAAAQPIGALLTGTDARIEVIKAGHVSLTCGRSMERKSLPILRDWLEAHSERMENG
jgi:polyhydroxyalkanoate synthase subunit PhaC